MTRRLSSRLLVLGLLAASLSLALACSSLGYYSQAAWGQTRILLARRDVVKLVADPHTPETLRGQLETVLELRRFAVGELHLPDNGSFRTYVELPPRDDGSRRRAVVWNVVAAPELDTSPVVWCFPVAGCVSYRGYFSRKRARKYADRLGRKGYDVAVSGAAAYSTLGWFEDPLLSTVVDYPEVDLAGLLFHELAHQVVYVKDDTGFNESFATAVELEGVRRWLDAGGGDPAELDAYRERKQREDRYVELLLGTRDRLREVYAAAEADDWKRERKREVLGELRQSAAAYGRRFERQQNNADLASVGAYHDLVPAFAALLAREDGDLEAFYAASRRLAELDAAAREGALRELAPAEEVTEP
jgi:predicted aminopeptidase